MAALNAHLPRLRQGALDNHPQGSGCVRTHFGDGPRFVVEDAPDDAGVGVAVEGFPAGEHFVDDDPQRPDVRSVIDRAAGGLLGRHVAHGAVPDEGVGIEGVFLSQFGQPEIEDSHVAELGDEDVRGLDVPMHDAVIVRACETGRDLKGDADHLVNRHGAAPDACEQGLPLVERHHDEEAPLFGLTDIVHGADVLMVEGRGGAGLLNESALARRVCCQIRHHHLDRHEPLEPDVFRFVDLARRPGAHIREDPIVRERAAQHVTNRRVQSGRRDWPALR
jgi:hypothetical protein